MKGYRALQEPYEILTSIMEDIEKKCPEKKWQIEPAMKHIEWIQEGLMQQKTLLWVWFLSTPWEIIRCMNLTAIAPEALFLIMAQLPGNMHFKYLDIPQMPEELCTYNKIPIGLALSGDLPPPDMVLYSAGHPCDASVTSYSTLAHYYKTASFYLDVPYLADERGYNYVANELKKMVSFIEEQFKQKLDLDRLREEIGYTNQALEYYRKLLNLRKNIPCPLFSRGLMIERTALLVLLGHPEFLDWVRRRYETAMELVGKGKREISQEEKIRLIVIGNPPNCDPTILDWLESEYGAVTVAMIQTDCLTEPIENMGDITEIFKGLAKRIMHLPMGRHGRLSADHFIDECIKMARDYKADGAIMLGHSGCKWNWASAYLVKDKINDELGIPVLNFEFDSVDSRFLSPEGMRAKFTEFFEIVFN